MEKFAQFLDAPCPGNLTLREQIRRAPKGAIMLYYPDYYVMTGANGVPQPPQLRIISVPVFIRMSPEEERAWLETQVPIVLTT